MLDFPRPPPQSGARHVAVAVAWSIYLWYRSKEYESSNEKASYQRLSTEGRPLQGNLLPHRDKARKHCPCGQTRDSTLYRDKISLDRCPLEGHGCQSSLKNWEREHARCPTSVEVTLWVRGRRAKDPTKSIPPDQNPNTIKE